MTHLHEARIAALALRSVSGSTNRSVTALAKAHGGSLERAARATLADRALSTARAELARIEEDGVRVLLHDEPAYPPLLREAPDAPLALYVRGGFDERDDPAVAIVGSRRATPEGRRIAHALGEGLARLGATVVSGLARGVDAEAHAGALEGEGRTIAVLGSGIDVVYPAEHRALAARVAERGALVSELPPGTGPLPWNFPARNRILAGLARAVIVVEAAERSGSLITAHLATEMGRAVLAVPGSPLAEGHRGTNKLIQEGARLLQSIEDVVDELPRDLRERLAALTVSPPEKPRAAAEERVLEALDTTEARTLDAVSAHTGQGPGELQPILLVLEMEHRVARLPGGRYLLVPSGAPLRGAQRAREGPAGRAVLSSGGDL